MMFWKLKIWRCSHTLEIRNIRTIIINNTNINTKNSKTRNDVLMEELVGSGGGISRSIFVDLVQFNIQMFLRILLIYFVCTTTTLISNKMNG